ncbi:hypothetical protein EWH08_16200 [Sphingobium indicum]|uniref:Uncharacterized protein n=1 Tax=Sphingobium indicum TaxID=332055 RepID=A0A4Q4J186_9SPHN|nr:hypothetical protein EWH08_16200 [Sphingobium indicum]
MGKVATHGRALVRWDGEGKDNSPIPSRAPAKAGAQSRRRAFIRRRNQAAWTNSKMSAIGHERTLVFRHPGLDPGSRFCLYTAPSPRQRDPGSSPG